jgi:hypothetical protein
MGELISREVYGPLKAEGRAEGKAEALIIIIDNRFGKNCLSKPLKEKILSCPDSKKLTSWIKIASKPKTALAEIEKLLKQSLI